MLGYAGLCSDHRTSKNIYVQIDIISFQKLTLYCYEYRATKTGTCTSTSDLFTILCFAQATHNTFKIRQGVLHCYWMMLHGKHNMFITHTPDLSYTCLGPLFLWHFSFVGAVQDDWSVMLHHPFLIALLSSVQYPLIYELIENHDCNLFVTFKGKIYIKMIIQTNQLSSAISIFSQNILAVWLFSFTFTCYQRTVRDLCLSNIKLLNTIQWFTEFAMYKST